MIVIEPMSVIRRQGIKNTIYTYLGILLGILSTLYIQPFFLTKEQIGLTRLVISVATICASVSCLGITSVIIRFFPFFRDSNTKHHGFFTLVVLFPMLGYLICVLAAGLFGDKIQELYGPNAAVLAQYAVPVLLTALFICFSSSFTAYCHALGQSSLPTFVAEVLSRVGFIACILLFFYGVTTENQYIYSLAILYSVQTLVLLLVITRFDRPRLSVDFFSGNPHLKAIIRFGILSSFMQITGVGLKFIDVLFVGKYLSMAQVGIYSIAAFIGLVLESPLLAVEKIAGSRIAHLFAERNFAEIKKVYVLSSKYLMVFCGLLLAVLVTCIEPALALLPGDYSSGTVVTIVICIGAFFNAATGVNYSILIYSNQYKLGAWFYSGLLVLTCVFNMWLIPLYGLLGAAIATAGASVLHNILRFAIIHSKLGMQPFTRSSGAVLLVIAVTVLVSSFIHTDNRLVLIVLRSVASVIVFLSLLLLLRVFSRRELTEEFLSLKKTFF